MLSNPGIFVTAVQGKEQQAEREIIEALEAAADELYPETAAGGNEDSGDGEDIEDMLKKELESLSAPGKKSARFRVCKRETACVCYILVFAPLDPVKLVYKVLERCERTAKCSFKFTQRLTPITATSGGYLDKLVAMAAETLPAGFEKDDGPLKFAINVSTRNSAKLERLEMIKAVAEEVAKLNPEHKVDLTNPDRTILLELYRTHLGMSVVSDFEKYKRFNPSRVAKEAAKAQGIEEEEDKTEETPAGSDKPKASVGELKNANRARRLAGIRETEAAANAERPPKRKAESELENGQVPRKADDVEGGEVVEDETAELGDEFQEVVQGGRATKVRREE
ncbi:hypothetical protein VHUM_00162 [Vanrija humicola]|uniref:THUMP domain-containing protein n=1 Tax=Vanrija humicola TaxID=5417 RepID=A0A7D8Z3R3_VANHU|nr:hypothetical protein VHUM_00162 [Vanrija humicola]